MKVKRKDFEEAVHGYAWGAGPAVEAILGQLGIKIEDEPEVVWEGEVAMGPHRLLRDGTMEFHDGKEWAECDGCAEMPTHPLRALADDLASTRQGEGAADQEVERLKKRMARADSFLRLILADDPPRSMTRRVERLVKLALEELR